eukprot:2108735-Pyramimonas_sp.AAC.1
MHRAVVSRTHLNYPYPLGKLVCPFVLPHTPSFSAVASNYSPAAMCVSEFDLQTGPTSSVPERKAIWKTSLGA